MTWAEIQHHRNMTESTPVYNVFCAICDFENNRRCLLLSTKTATYGGCSFAKWRIFFMLFYMYCIMLRRCWYASKGLRHYNYCRPSATNIIKHICISVFWVLTVIRLYEEWIKNAFVEYDSTTYWLIYIYINLGASALHDINEITFTCHMAHETTSMKFYICYILLLYRMCV